jgi:hypothetical protein
MMAQRILPQTNVAGWISVFTQIFGGPFTTVYLLIAYQVTNSKKVLGIAVCMFLNVIVAATSNIQWRLQSYESVEKLLEAESTNKSFLGFTDPRIKYAGLLWTVVSSITMAVCAILFWFELPPVISDVAFENAPSQVMLLVRYPVDLFMGTLMATDFIMYLNKKSLAKKLEGEEKLTDGATKEILDFLDMYGVNKGRGEMVMNPLN